MKAIRYTDYQTFPQIVDVDKPTAGPGEVVLKVAASGACHSDVAVFNDFVEGTNPLCAPQFTLGHEVAGWADEIGEGVDGIERGAAYVVYGPVGCGYCRFCMIGQDTFCENVAQVGYLGIGLGRDGGMAEYVVVPARNLVPLGDADPVKASALADAGLTPYHAIKLALPKLNKAGSSALVIGLGGLGLLAVQILKAMTGATIIATDTKEEALREAEKYGAITVASGDDQAAKIRELTGGRGVDAVFDMVGIGPTVETAMTSVATQGRVSIVGLGAAGSDYGWQWYKEPYEAELVKTYWGTLPELGELVVLLQQGHLEPQYTTYSLDEGLDAYQKLVDGQVSGRAIIVPNERF